MQNQIQVSQSRIKKRRSSKMRESNCNKEDQFPGLACVGEMERENGPSVRMVVKRMRSA